MPKVLVSLSDDLVRRMRSLIPNGKRSQIIAKLLEEELVRREEELYKRAAEVERDEALNKEMEEWEATVGDGIEPESW
ncbi:MAG: hypothetical protein DRH11_15370 [Deltaproteobacteria bacterium]|nr:MAG: hypothetical protein DRH11_15370 [Deltaproteobacteria bacterium]